MWLPVAERAFVAQRLGGVRVAFDYEVGIGGSREHSLSKNSSQAVTFRDLSEQPCARAGPLPIYRAGRDPKGRGGFGHRHSGEVA